MSEKVDIFDAMRALHAGKRVRHPDGEGRWDVTLVRIVTEDEDGDECDYEDISTDLEWEVEHAVTRQDLHNALAEAIPGTHPDSIAQLAAKVAESLGINN